MSAGGAVLILRAAGFAAAAHAGQIRKGRDRSPYIIHPIRVAELVAEVTGDAEVLAAALLHDVVEDTGRGAAEVAASFGDRVAALVVELTDAAEWTGLPLAERKARQAAKFRHASRDACVVKIADQLSNIEDLAAEPEVWPRERHEAYLAGARAIVEACRPAAPDLAARFDALAARYAGIVGGLGGG